jgi:integrase
LAALIETYRKSPDWRRLAESTRTSRLIAYDHLEPIHHTVSGLTRRNIVGIRDQLADKPGTATTVLIAIKALLSWAVNHDWIEVNPALGVKGFGTTRGNRRWHDHEVRAVLDHPEIPERVKLAVMLALYTGQRRTDCIRMQWSAYDGRIIRLRQQKTGTELVIPVHPDLKAALDREPRKALTILTSSAERRGLRPDSTRRSNPLSTRRASSARPITACASPPPRSLPSLARARSRSPPSPATRRSRWCSGTSTAQTSIGRPRPPWNASPGRGSQKMTKLQSSRKGVRNHDLGTGCQFMRNNG